MQRVKLHCLFRSTSATKMWPGSLHNRQGKTCREDARFWLEFFLRLSMFRLEEIRDVSVSPCLNGGDFEGHKPQGMVTIDSMTLRILG